MASRQEAESCIKRLQIRVGPGEKWSVSGISIRDIAVSNCVTRQWDLCTLELNRGTADSLLTFWKPKKKQKKKQAIHNCQRSYKWDSVELTREIADSLLIFWKPKAKQAIHNCLRSYKWFLFCLKRGTEPWNCRLLRYNITILTLTIWKLTKDCGSLVLSLL